VSDPHPDPVVPDPVVPDPVVLVVGADGASVGTLARDLRDQGHRVGAFVGDPAEDQDDLVATLAELTAELYGRRPSGD